ncbi:Na(+)-translocating NADH-quinone reductase subunit A [Subsaximicrobium wynnwilliamsii]|uniref:Na(+)-translocating NADH-quinone reductase subunit A n=1 Tax=Subsaximicrobium wynnwilliamsii TaxID=291179 RepID=A0A5C6ZBU9_9FLAO|nr:Na(+)-translocating NADH-quinone reductase subunit A [Subsaximicrobium wynnwilliamsii]TXD81830.1 Na(+)-translocating NADH-quinone reductase subunit A [Subsaximicrobium wynnwilliamsii]TXD87499.1 Na(+)-translocating NADH-quinone reductase subunit A [Subsaximicrobium wynnwilliamsii]TXE01182.1 Na(+)-translocating NADH-quinone reductase subunit A [Subsaximicrobium wynnwilliamsii]
MSNDIKIKKGLDIKLQGEAEKVVEQATFSNFCTLRPEDFHSVTPKLVAKEGDMVMAGDVVFHDKSYDAVKFVSPVSGKVVEVLRGPKRRIDAIKILADKEQSHKDFGVFDSNANAETTKSHLLSSGCWPFIKQRPYDVIADPDSEPKAIFISGYDTAPLAADLDYTLSGKEAELQAAVSALAKLTPGKIHVGVKSNTSPLAGLEGVTVHKVSGPHPAGNVGTHINKINPVNKGETVWTINPADLVIMGELLLTGKFNAERMVALVGSSVQKPRYFKTLIGSEVSTMVYDNGVDKNGNDRIISGNVLTGKQVKPDGNLGYYSNLISVIPEGDDYEFFGWNKPVFDKVSTSRALTFSWMQPNKKYDLNTNTNGEHRAFVITGIYEDVFPLDIFPMQILKACMYEDLDEMEALGMYEVAPEDFALTEFVCVSKQPHQQIIRNGLDLMLKEIG